MWQASQSKRDGAGRLVATERWAPAFVAATVDRLRGVLAGVGDPSLERVVRMALSLSVYRATAEEEAAALPVAFWQCPPVHLFGGAVEIVSETVPGKLSTRPCEHPGRSPIGGDRRAWC